jgi:hypothetical protein
MQPHGCTIAQLRDIGGVATPRLSGKSHERALDLGQ